MSLNTLIVIPVKDFGAAKTRLHPVLGPQRRSALARELCERTLAFFRRHFPQHPLLVVTASGAIAALARTRGAQVLPELRAAGLSAAARLAAAWARRQGFASMLLVPADIVNLDVREFRRLLAQPRTDTSVLICPASDGGTNALLTTPPDVLPFCFGEGSSLAHRDRAAELGLSWRMLQFEHLRFDLDTPADLETLSQQQSGPMPRELVSLCRP